MNRIPETARRRGMALISTLVLLAFLSLMITAVVRGNMAQRKYLRARRSDTMALCLAESGVAEALRAIARQSGGNKIEAADPAGGKFRVEWREERPGTGAYEIRSVGINDAESFPYACRIVTVSAEAPVGHPPRILSWNAAGESENESAPAAAIKK